MHELEASLLRLTICLDGKELDAVKAAAEANDRSVSGVVRRAVKLAIKSGELDG